MSSDLAPIQELYRALDAAVNQTLKFMDAEFDWLQARERQTPSRVYDAVCEHEARMIRYGQQTILAWGRHNNLDASGWRSSLSPELRATVRRVQWAIRERIELWGWDMATADGDRVTVALVARRKAALNRLVAAAVAVRERRNQADALLGALAASAPMLRVDPSATEEVDDDRLDDLMREWFDRPMLLDDPPEISVEDHVALRADATELHAYLRSIIPPCDIPAYVEALETAGCVPPEPDLDRAAEPTPEPAEKSSSRQGKKGRPPETDFKADAKHAKAWRGRKPGQYPTREAYEKAKGLNPGDLTRLLGRVGHRERKPTA